MNAKAKIIILRRAKRKNIKWSPINSAKNAVKRRPTKKVRLQNKPVWFFEVGFFAVLQ
jgi:hypothetical protein